MYECMQGVCLKLASRPDPFIDVHLTVFVDQWNVTIRSSLYVIVDLISVWEVWFKILEA